MTGPTTRAWDRDEARARLADEAWDVVVVGGGVTGAGVARDAALRGLRVACVEAGDWAAGTSSRTTKFAHGGLRYLEHFDVRLVKIALAERATLLAIAPHLTRASPFLLPVYRGRTRPSWKLRIGLGMYDALAGRTRLGRHHFLAADQALLREPFLRTEDLRGAGIYWDARVRDARLVIETLADARRAGAVVASYCAVEDVERWDEGWVGEVVDRVEGSSFTVRGRVWINATGPWGDRLRKKAAPGAAPIMTPTKGIHITVPHERVPLGDPTALFAGDGRLYFAVPSGAWTYIGTTDTRDPGGVDDLGVADADVAYLVQAANDALTAEIEVADVVGAWAGWRPLVHGSGRDPSSISRDEVVETTAPGFITVAGGKMTTYRRMAESAVDRAVEIGGWRTEPCSTAARTLVPASVGGDPPPRDFPPSSVGRVRELFGPDADDVFRRWRADPASAEPLGEGFPYTAAEVERAAREMVETLDDLVDRRLTGLPGGVPVSRRTLARIAEAAAPVIGWDVGRQAAEVDAFRGAADRWPPRAG